MDMEDYPMAAVKAAADQLQAAVITTMDPAVTQQQRKEAYQHCDNFKAHSPLCIPVGVHLSVPENPSIARRFGLHILDYVIKLNWVKLKPTEKAFIKDRMFDLMRLPNSLHENYIRAGAAVILAEIAKREWPQGWMNMFVEFEQLAFLGCDQAETVILAILRIVEDVATLQSMNNANRRRDLYQNLTSDHHMSFILQMILKILTSSVEESEKKDITEEQKLKVLHLARVTLELLSNLLEWVSQSFLLRKELPVLPTLCSLLLNESLRYSATESLVALSSRKGNPEERKVVVNLFEPKEFGHILTTLQTLLKMPFESPECYCMIRNLTSVMAGMGTILVVNYAKNTITDIPSVFPEFLELALTLTAFPSHTMAGILNSMWSAMFSDEKFCQLDILQRVAARWLQHTMDKMRKPAVCHTHTVFPDDAMSQCAALDFGDVETFLCQYSRIRQELVNSIRVAAAIFPDVLYDFVGEWTQLVLKMPVDGKGENMTQSATYLEWEALAMAVDQVYGKYQQLHKKPPLEQRLLLLKEVLDYETDNADLLSVWLSVVSAMFVFVACSPDNIPVVLDKIFACAKFMKPGEILETRGKDVINLRRHACSLMVKICRNHPKEMVSYFDKLLFSIEKMVADPGMLSKMEKVTLYEALMLLSNELMNYQKQSSFLSEAMTTVKEEWQKVLPAFQSSADFISFVGLDKEPVEPSDQDVYGQNRSNITYCISFFQAAVKRISPVDDRNACSPHILQVLPGVLSLLGALNGLWHPNNFSKINPAFVSVFNMNTHEKRDIIGLPQLNSAQTTVDSRRTPFDRMQKFIHSVHEAAANVLGLSFEALGNDLFGDPPGRPGLAEALLTTNFSFLDLMPDYRIRPVVKITLKRLICRTPPSSWDTLLIPILTKLCPFFYSHLSRRWQPDAPPAMQGLGEESAERLEMLDDQLKRLLTREYILGLQFVLFGGNARQSVKGDSMQMEDDENEEIVSAKPSQTDSLTELGQKAVMTPVLGEALILTVFNSLSWGDTVSCSKAVTYCVPVLRWLADGPRLNNDQACELLTLILRGIQQHGQHEMTQGSLVGLVVAFYQLFREHFPEIDEILKQIPDATNKKVEMVSNKILNPGSEKTKRDMMRNLLKPITGQALSQLGKMNIYIQSLPEISLKAPRRKEKDVFQTVQGDVGLESLFSDSTNHVNGLETVKHEEPMDT